MARKKILLVDHIEQDAQEFRKALIASGFEVCKARQKSEILDCFKSSSPDLIIIETKTPDINLASLVEEIRSNENFKLTPIIASGSPRTVDERLSVLGLDVDDFIYKPYDLEEAIARIEILLREVRRAAEKAPARAGGFNGSLSEMNLVDLIQTLEVGKKTGVIKLHHSGKEGQVFISDGEVVDAALRDDEPKEALMRMFTWSEGYFSVEMKSHTSPKRIFTTTRELASEGMTRQYRWAQLANELPPLNSIAMAAASATDADVTRDEWQIFEGLNGGKSLINLIEDSEFDDLKALRLLKSLFDKGKIVEAPAQNHILQEAKLEKFSREAQNGKRRTLVVENVFSGLLRKPEKADNFGKGGLERRRNDRRSGDRRSRVEHDPEIRLNKTELVMLREKLLSTVNDEHNKAQA